MAKYITAIKKKENDLIGRSMYYTTNIPKNRQSKFIMCQRPTENKILKVVATSELTNKNIWFNENVFNVQPDLRQIVQNKGFPEIVAFLRSGEIEFTW